MVGSCDKTTSVAGPGLPGGFVTKQEERTDHHDHLFPLPRCLPSTNDVIIQTPARSDADHRDGPLCGRPLQKCRRAGSRLRLPLVHPPNYTIRTERKGRSKVKPKYVKTVLPTGRHSGRRVCRTVTSTLLTGKPYFLPPPTEGRGRDRT